VGSAVLGAFLELASFGLVVAFGFGAVEPDAEAFGVVDFAEDPPPFGADCGLLTGGWPDSDLMLVDFDFFAFVEPVAASSGSVFLFLPAVVLVLAAVAEDVLVVAEVFPFFNAAIASFSFLAHCFFRFLSSSRREYGTASVPLFNASSTRFLATDLVFEGVKP
jgi:hypothetical protein